MQQERSNPDLGIIILNWNGWRDTIECVNSVYRSGFPVDRMKIIVIDNCSSDESIVQLKALKGITLISTDDNLGFAFGNNLGIKEAIRSGCEYILLLNNDTIVTPGFIEPMMRIFNNERNVGIVCPKILYYSLQNVIWFAGGKFRQPRLIGEMVGKGQKDCGQYDVPRKIDFAVGTCLLTKKTILDKVGLLDERYFMYEEDVDFSIRVSRAGYFIWYQPSATILHKVSQSTEANIPLRNYYYAQSRMIFFLKHIRGIRIPIVFILEFIRLLRIILQSLFADKLTIGKNYVSGLMAGIKRYTYINDEEKAFN
jgi:GT2 family glycosyltransferase